MIDTDQVILHLVRRAKNGDNEAFKKILAIFDAELKKIANKYYIVGSDEQDVYQECKIGVWKAVKDFDETKDMTFKNFCLNLCCKRHLITAMSHANTQKFRLQNEAVSLSAPVPNTDDEGITYADYIADPQSDVLESYIIQEEFNTNLDLISGKLTNLEMSIFNQYAIDSSYKDIAEALEVKPKTVDNALMRIRKKSVETYQYYLNTCDTINVGYCTSAVVKEYLEMESFFVGIGSSLAFGQ